MKIVWSEPQPHKTEVVILTVAVQAGGRISRSRLQVRTETLRAQSSRRLLHTDFQRLLGVDHSLSVHNRFEASFDLEIKLVVPISRGMRSTLRVCHKSAPSSLVGANALENPPRLLQGSRLANHVFDLIALR